MEKPTKTSDINEAGAALYSKIRELGLSPEQTEAQREQFNEVVDRVVGLYPNDEQRACLTVAAGVMQWLHFGEVGDPLPCGLIKIIDDETKDVIVNVDERLIHEDDLYSAWRLFGYEKYDATDPYRISRQTHDQIESEVTELIKNTEGYKLINSFIAKTPQQPAPNQLPQWWRTVRESQINAEVRQQYGVADRDYIPKNSLADLALRKRLFHLDDETQPCLNLQPNVNDPVAKMRKFFTPLILNALREEATNLKKCEVNYFRRDDGDGEYYGYLSKDDEEYNASIFDCDFLETYYDTLRKPGSYKLTAIQWDYLEFICNNMFSDELPNNDYHELVEQAIKQTHDYFVDCFNDPSFFTLQAFLRQATGNPIYKSF